MACSCARAAACSGLGRLASGMSAGPAGEGFRFSDGDAAASPTAAAAAAAAAAAVVTSAVPAAASSSAAASNVSAAASVATAAASTRADAAAAVVAGGCCCCCSTFRSGGKMPLGDRCGDGDPWPSSSVSSPTVKEETLLESWKGTEALLPAACSAAHSRVAITSADAPRLRARSSGVSSPISSLATTASGYAAASAATTACGARASTA